MTTTPLAPNLIDNITKVADFMESLPADQLEMENYVSAGPRTCRPSLCDSVCCVLGWTPLIVDCEEYNYPKDGYNYNEIMENIFGTFYRPVTTELFGTELPNDPKEVADRLRLWAKSGGNTAQFLNDIDMKYPTD